MRTLSSFAIAVAALTLLGSSLASAQDDDYDGPRRGVARDSGHFDVKLMLGIGGEVETEADVGPVTGTTQDDLELSYGVGLAYLHPLHRFFALGAQLSVSSWISEAQENADLDRNMFIDLSLLPQGRYAINNAVELYLTIPLGLTISVPGEDEIGTGTVTVAEINTAIGFHIGLMLGARFAITDGFGLLAELGYVAHAAAHEVEAAGVSEDFDVSTGQFALNLGVWF
jgi:hypothetical protein